MSSFDHDRSVVLTGPLFRPLANELVTLLEHLSPEAWAARASNGTWTVKDVAAHLLDGDLRRISVDRDRHRLPPPEPIRGYDDLLAHLSRLNSTWVDAARRVSPRLLCDLLRVTGSLVGELMETADPHGPATFPVAWAGQRASPMWLDMGREYTERWHHQDQIREAVGAELLDGPEWLGPVMGISLFALPWAYRSTVVPDGTTIALEVVGPGGGDWLLERSGDWRLARGRASRADCTIRGTSLHVARLLLHRLPSDQVRDGVAVTGSGELAAPFFAARAVMV